MNKRYRLGEIEEAVSEMEELIGLEDDIAETDDDLSLIHISEPTRLTVRSRMPSSA